MKPYIVGLAGGSGSGKSTLAFGLEDAFPEQVTVFHLDDYFRPEAEVPVKDGLVNWDSPEALFSERMINDLNLLKLGQSAIVNTKSPRLNPAFLKTGKRILVSLEPKRLIVVEGFLTLHFPGLRELIDLAIYLDAPFELHTERRVHGKLHNFPEAYNEKILRPMHDQYVAPSKQNADCVIDVSTLYKEAVLEKVKSLLPAEVTTA